MKSWLFAGLLVLLSPDFTQVRHETKSYEGLIPGTQVVEDSAHWRSGRGEFFAFFWRPRPARDNGPMVAEESWTVEVLGRQASVSRTSMFFGVESEVLVAHLELEEGFLMIYSPDLQREQFEKILRGLNFQTDGKQGEKNE